MADAALIPIEQLAEMISYDPDTGALTWLRRDRKYFPSDRSWKIWNARFPGKPAIAGKHSRGYLTGTVDSVQHYAHRVCWALAKGGWPEGEIDHINGDRTDNRIANLRDVSRGENNKNKQIGVRNRSGALGVMLDHTGRYRVRITVNYRTIELGRYGNFIEALSVRKAAEERYGYHSNHGREALEAA